jgi:hypothetical protein
MNTTAPPSEKELVTGAKRLQRTRSDWMKIYKAKRWRWNEMNREAA